MFDGDKEIGTTTCMRVLTALYIITVDRLSQVNTRSISWPSVEHSYLSIEMRSRRFGS